MEESSLLPTSCFHGAQNHCNPEGRKLLLCKRERETTSVKSFLFRSCARNGWFAAHTALLFTPTLRRWGDSCALEILCKCFSLQSVLGTTFVNDCRPSRNLKFEIVIVTCLWLRLWRVWEPETKHLFEGLCLYRKAYRAKAAGTEKTGKQVVISFGWSWHPFTLPLFCFLLVEWERVSLQLWLLLGW